MAGQITFDPDHLMAFLSSVMGTDFKGEILRVLVDILYQQGVVDSITFNANLIAQSVMKQVNEQALSFVFGRIPGFWSLVPYALYEPAKNVMTQGIVSDVFYEKIDFYHEIQGRIPVILQAGMEKGVQISILSKYGFCGIPAVPSQKGVTDMVVDTCYSSLGAVCAATDAPFNDRTGTNVSSDGMIDASACAFPSQTWFLKNISHTAHPLCELQFIDILLDSENQPTVNTYPEYPRFLIQTQEGTLMPLTSETDHALYSLPVRETDFFARLRRLLDDFRRIFDELRGLMRETVQKKLSFPAGKLPA